MATETALCGFHHEEEEILDPMDLIKNYQEHRRELNAEIDKVLEEITVRLNEIEAKLT